MPREGPVDAGSARLHAAELLAQRLDRPMGVLGVLVLFVVLGQVLASEGWLVTILAVIGWVLWAVFVGEFLLRAYIAGFGAAFWKRNWWQVIFLLVPFLRFLRALSLFRVARLARVARLGGVLSAGVRGSRSAGRLLSNHLAWLIVVTAVVILAASQLHYLGTGGIRYSTALFEATMATITGTGLRTDTALGRVLQVALAMYSVGVFATLTGSVGAYFLRSRGAEPGSDLGPTRADGR